MKKIIKSIILIITLLNMLSYKFVNNTSINNTKETKYKENYLFEIEIPKINLKKEVYNLDSELNNVNIGIELLKPLSLPENENSCIILASHNGNSNVSYFNKLYKLELKDKIIINYNQKKYVYQIVNIYDILKNGKAVIKKYNYNNIVVLITCKGNDKQTIYIASLIS